MPKCRRTLFSYTTTVLAIESLSSALTERMTQLYLDNYEGSSKTLFTGDLSTKDEVLLLFADGDLVGFTTLLQYVSTIDGRTLRVVYSGDTIVDKEHWGQQQLARAWISRIGRIKAEAPDTPLYWFLLVKGHRTFKYLSVFGNSFHPHWNETRPDLKRIADVLALERFGKAYNPASGIVSFTESRGHLRPQIAEPTAEELTKPSTRFFVEMNVGFRTGHELVCICELEQSNMKPLAARIFSKAMLAGDHE